MQFEMRCKNPTASLRYRRRRPGSGPNSHLRFPVLVNLCAAKKPCAKSAASAGRRRGQVCQPRYALGNREFACMNEKGFVARVTFNFYSVVNGLKFPRQRAFRMIDSRIRLLRF